MPTPHSIQDASPLIHALLNSVAHRQRYDSMQTWFEDFKAQTNIFTSTIDKAALGGFVSKQLAFSFSSGYQSAVSALFNCDPSKLASICISEEGGNHPRAINTSIEKYRDGYVINGHKKFVSGGPQADLLYVACKAGDDERGRPQLAIVELAANAVGIEISPMPTLPFIPEIEHGQFKLTKVEVNQGKILEGDGYDKYIKPFRTVEDLHVLAATTGHRIGLALEHNWGNELIERHLALLLSLRSLGFMNHSDPATHIGLAGCRREMKALMELSDPIFEKNAPDAFAFWKRDKAIFSVAQKAHTKRTENAWSAFLP